MTCELCDTIDWKDGETFRMVECKTCKVPMLVLREHRQFTDFEKWAIIKLFKRQIVPFDNEKTHIRWTQRKIKDHAHCHFE